MFRRCHLLVLLLFISLQSLSQKVKRDWSKPPNGIQIADNLFIDQTEISNINWLEFEYDAKGFTDKEILSSTSLIPDTTTWSKINPCFQILDNYYARFPKTRYFPSVGISHEQARLYTTWRENAVFHAMLLKDKKIKPPTKSKHNFGFDHPYNFTIKSYFNGTYPYINKKKKKATHYWKFSLPTAEEFELAVAYNDSITHTYLSKCQKEECRKCTESFNQLVVATTDLCTSLPPTEPVSPDCYPENAVLHLRDNVSEWLSEEGVSAGGAWIHARNAVLSSLLIQKTATNAFTGFRNVARWVKWEKER